MKYRKLLIYLFPFLMSVILCIHGTGKMPTDILICVDTNIYQRVLHALQVAFETNESTMLAYFAWLATYSIVFEFSVIIIKLITFLPKLMDNFLDRILGGKYEKV